MSLPRAATCLVRGFQQPAASKVPQICSICRQALSKAQQHHTSQRRFLATASAHQPQSLEQHAPPRNAGIPDTSIAGGIAKVDNAHSFSNTRETPSNAQNVGIPESEAQQPRPTQNATSGVATPQPSPSQEKPKRSKLRPKKNVMTLTPKAVSQLKQLLDQPDPKLIRVGVKNKGCSGLAYHLEYVDKPAMLDETVEQDGVKVLVDTKALFSIIGSEMDWTEDKLSARFVFKNPNITEQCGCGESFSIS